MYLYVFECTIIIHLSEHYLEKKYILIVRSDGRALIIHIEGVFHHFLSLKHTFFIYLNFYRFFFLYVPTFFYDSFNAQRITGSIN